MKHPGQNHWKYHLKKTPCQSDYYSFWDRIMRKEFQYIITFEKEDNEVYYKPN